MAPIKSLPEQLPAPPETKKNGRRSRRHRRVLWSAAGLAITGLLGIAVGVQFYRDHQPQTYKPGEDLADVSLEAERPPLSRTLDSNPGSRGLPNHLGFQDHFTIRDPDRPSAGPHRGY